MYRELQGEKKLTYYKRAKQICEEIIEHLKKFQDAGLEKDTNQILEAINIELFNVIIILEATPLVEVLPKSETAAKRKRK
jgi:hypothetical protein